MEDIGPSRVFSSLFFLVIDLSCFLTFLVFMTYNTLGIFCSSPIAARKKCYRFGNKGNFGNL